MTILKRWLMDHMTRFRKLFWIFWFSWDSKTHHWLNMKWDGFISKWVLVSDQLIVNVLFCFGFLFRISEVDLPVPQRPGLQQEVIFGKSDGIVAGSSNLKPTHRFWCLVALRWGLCLPAPYWTGLLPVCSVFNCHTCQNWDWPLVTRLPGLSRADLHGFTAEPLPHVQINLMCFWSHVWLCLISSDCGVQLVWSNLRS